MTTEPSQPESKPADWAPTPAPRLFAVITWLVIGAGLGAFWREVAELFVRLFS